ncbi:MAG: DUF4918 family protein [Bacteroidetes bacterium]|nr:DUF4918 family protein [Bacteroidota bacterium]MDA1120719.1 DUF4918 family protein [Bacteroidota bacterium]
MTFGESVLNFYKTLTVPRLLPAGIDILYPFKNNSTWELVEKFFMRYYSDNNPRTLLLGINPGRYGSGLTGIGFTDPIRLEYDCGIPNDFDKRPELSSTFFYDVIRAYGGPKEFYSLFFISAVSPLGFVKNGKNYNYYDEKKIETAIEPFAVNCLKNQLNFGCSPNIAISIGQGKNVSFLNRINHSYQLFKRIESLPHPRWVMQYRLKRKEEFIQEYLKVLNSIELS